jgi:SAM-dependent methyltransferase
MARDTQEVMDKLHALAQGKKLVLHLGCGVNKPEKLLTKFRNDEWFEVRCDINKAVHPHILADMQKLNMLPDGAVDAVWNSHSIEHLYAHQVVPALKEWHRVLKEGGELHLTLPDLKAVATHVAHGRLEDALYTSPAGPITALDIVYGYGLDIAAGNHFMAHRTGFTAETLAKKLQQAGFGDINVLSKELNLWAGAVKPHDGKRGKITIQRPEGQDVKPPPAPPLSTQRHPGALWPQRMSDELDVPPQKLK